jgi:hypothetical protein
MAMAFFGSTKDLSILHSTSSSLADFFRGGAFLKPAIHFSTSALAEASSSTSVFSYDRGAQSLLNGDEIDFFAPPKLYWIVMKLSSFVMLSSQDAKLSSCAVAALSLLVAAAEQSLAVAAMELSLVLAMAELAAVVVAVT